MAGGRGTRISELFPDIPKPLIPVDGIPVLEREICSLRDQGFTDLILTVSHMGEKIQAHFGDGSRLGVQIEYFFEETPLGNAGALWKLEVGSPKSVEHQHHRGSRFFINTLRGSQPRHC